MKKNPEYEKMPKHFKNLDISEKSLGQVQKLKWVVTEKVHGANFSFVYENKKLLFAKRREYLQWSDDFFGFQTVVSQLEENIIRLFEQLSQDFPANRYIVYGELFGGEYPHPQVEPDTHVQAIQTGIYYSPSIHFCAFDIAMETGEDPHKQYLDYKTAVDYFEKFGIFYAQPLFTGKLNEAMDFNIRISSKIPSQLNLPALETNLIEGVVIKPFTHSELKDLETRPVIKLKNPEFDEEKKFHEAEKWSYIPGTKSRSEELQFLIDEMVPHINSNRLQSVLSKTGKIDFTNEKRMNEIKTEFLEDVFTDFNDQHDKILDEITTTDLQWIKDRLHVYMMECIRGGNSNI